MQCKAITNGGPCRGHPLIRGSTRDGPYIVGSWWTLTDTWLRTCFDTRNSKLETRNSKPETRNSKLETRNSSTLFPFARDWPGFTCSISSSIRLNRHKYRWKPQTNPAGYWRRGRVIAVQSLKLAACSLQPQASSLKPQAASCKPQAASC
jgi:hypothetical protein